MLMFVNTSVTNSDNGTISVLAQVTWTASSMPNGIITHSVTIQSGSGSVVHFEPSLDESATSFNVNVTLVPAEMFLARVQVLNGAGSNETDSPLALSPQGGEIFIFTHPSTHQPSISNSFSELAENEI